MTLDELDKKWERDLAIAAAAAAAVADGSADHPDLDPADDLINACILLEEIGKWFDLLLDKGVVGKPLSRKVRKEMQQLSDGIIEYLSGVEEGLGEIGVTTEEAAGTVGDTGDVEDEGGTV